MMGKPGAAAAAAAYLHSQEARAAQRATLDVLLCLRVCVFVSWAEGGQGGRRAM
jgi:hypothetical protein